MSDDMIDLSNLIREAQSHLSNAEFRRKFERRDFLAPNPAQQRLLDSTAQIVFMQVANQLGKSTVAAYYASMYGTNTPIPNYKGREWFEPKLHRAFKRVIWILAGETGQTALMGMATALFGDTISGNIGTGMLPFRCIKKVTYAHGTPGLISEAVIDNHDGEQALIRVRTYSQGREALTSEAVDLIICDELPPDMALWTELITRLTATNGRLILTATPNKQGAEVPRWFQRNAGQDTQIIRGSLDEATHIDQAAKDSQAALYKSVSDAEYRTRYCGDMFAGGGAVIRFTDAIYDDGFDRTKLPKHTRYILGLDIGHGGISSQAHPHAAVGIAKDDLDVYHVIYAQRWKGVDLANFALQVLQWEIGDAPCAWGKDFLQGMAGTNETYAATLKGYGLDMLAEHTTTRSGSVSSQAMYGIVQTLINEGRLKIPRHLADLIEEMRSLEYDEDQKVIAQFDDIVSALRYALVMAEDHNAARTFIDTPYGKRRGPKIRYLDSGQDPLWGDTVPRVRAGDGFVDENGLYNGPMFSSK